MRRTLLFCLLAAMHLAVTIGLLIVVFGAGMARFDTGGEAQWLEAMCGRLLDVLAFPVLTVLEHGTSRRFPGLWGYLPFAANSALWSAAALGVLKIARRRPAGR
jgi:hypothetical protein